ncbi:MAG: hypothetical protein GVY12_12570 [Bacteroidetes bacterium]|jgi:hypothetical protein|nr:hypothetical protein [Bacteroidota bacterium]
MAGSTENEDGQRGKLWRVVAWTVAALLLLLPLVAMQFTDEVHWTLGDFVVAGVLLFGALGVYEGTVRTTGEPAYRAAVGAALAGAFLLIWINGAVGIIGSEDHPANLMYGGVLALAVIGILIARFQPQGMAYALLATALAQALVPVLALLIWKPPMGSAEEFIGVAGVFVLNGFFVALWLGSAWLFWKAARAGTAPSAE